MERIRQVTLVAVAAAALAGCAGTDRLSATYHDAKRAVGLDPATARPATQLALIMQRRLASLPDPLHPDATQTGLPGQVFLMGADGKPVPAVGELTLTVIDESPRPAGQAPRTTEKWQFTPDVLPRLKVRDERFGECYVLFLPWPADWKDVTRVTVKGNYKLAGAVELHAPEVTLNLDLGPAAVQDTWEKLGASKGEPPPVAPFQPIQLPPAAEIPPQLLPPPVGSQPIPTVPQTVVIPRGS